MGASGMKKKQKDGERSGLWESGTLSPRSGWKSSSQTGGSWTEHVVAGGARRLTNVIAVAGTCSCIYALLIIFTSHPCWQSVSCRGPNCTPRQVSLTQASRRNIASQPGGSENPSIFKHPAQQQSEALRMRLESTSITPRSLPIGHALAVNPSTSTNLSHIVFGIAASSNLWDKRKEYTKLWWRPGKMRGFVWLDRGTKQRGWEDTLPPWKISGNISRFKYTNKQGRPSAIRISRIVSETFRLGLRDVHWFVMGDDDTVFIPENLVRVLSKYDHRQYYYIGSSSESHLQNIVFSYNMAYGGGGFAISYPLAKALEKMQDGCLQRYPGLFGSDDRIQACMAELGVPLTREPGFHQYDVYGNLFGLMAAHPVTPVVSIHHLDVVEPIFPNRTRVEGLKHLSQAIKVDPAGFLQQSICYDKQNKWSISVSWGFAVQVVRGIFSPRELEMPSRTFYNWYKKADYTAYAFNTRPFYRHPCQKPFVFYMQNVSDGGSRGQVVSNYTREQTKPLECRWNMSSPSTIDWIKIVKELDRNMWTKAPRRKCCRVVSSSKTSMEIDVGVCGDGQIVAVE